MNNIKLKKKAVYISLAIGVGMFLAKMGAYLITGSTAIFSDAAESVVHVLATLMALYSIILSSKPADDTHLYGHGNIEFFSAGIEGFLIIIAAVYIIYEAVVDIIVGSELKQLSIGVIVITAAGAINLFLGLYLIKMGKNTNSLTLIADGKHVLTDSYTSIGVIIGITIVIVTGIELFDPLFAIAVAINIFFTGYKLIRESVGGLMNETDKELMQKIVEHLSEIRKDYWIDIHELRFWKSGDIIYLDFHLIVPFYFTVQQTHNEEREIRESLKKIIYNIQTKIHFDYCLPDLCKYCNYNNCSERKDIKSKQIEWDINKLKGKPIYMVDKK